MKTHALTALRNTLIFLTVGLFAATTATASAASSPSMKMEAATSTPSIVDMLAEATVNIYCTLKSGRTTYGISGSGVVISSRGIILTNAHVAQYLLLAREEGRVTGKCTVRTGSPAKSAYSVSILYIPLAWLEDNVSKMAEKNPKGTGENDFALLYIPDSDDRPPTSLPALRAGALATSTEDFPVMVAGYPTEKLDFKKIRNMLVPVFATSSVTNLQSFDQYRRADLLTVAPSAAGAHGISGGPIVGDDHLVLGIVAVKSSDKKDRTIRGITTSYIDRMLRMQTGFSLEAMLASNFEARASTTHARIPDSIVKELESGLRKKK